MGREIGVDGEVEFEALSHEAEVGVKWRWKRVCFASHRRTFSCLWV